VTVDPTATGALEIRQARSLDNERLGIVELAGAGAGTPPLAADLSDDAVADALARMRLLRAAEMAGGAARTLSLTRDYMLERRQFGVALGSFQAVQHHLANMLIDVDAALLSTREGLSLAALGREIVLAAAIAGYIAGRSYTRVTVTAAQLFGGIGAAKEHRLHHHFRRARAMQLRLGSVPSQLLRIADAALDEAPPPGPWPRWPDHSSGAGRVVHENPSRNGTDLRHDDPDTLRPVRILVTGAAGMLGLDLVTAITAAGHEPIALAHAELDITDAQAVRDAVASARPAAVINSAGYTNVDGAETDEAMARAVNGDGAGNVAAAAAAVNAWTVHVSTDYVFDGTKSDDGYVESDPVGPRSAYGRTKLAGERAVAAAAPGAHTIVRASWLFGTGGPCFPRTIMRLAGERDQLSVVDDQVGCPTFTGHLAPALVQLARTAAPVAGIVHVAGGGRCSWFEFAREIVGQAGIACEVRPCTTAEFPRPAPRPAFSVLVSERDDTPRLPPWHRGLTEFMAKEMART
jgi:dTDP-4-dehydrorhamnose reductase